MIRYPELADKSEWTPRMLYIHRRAMILGLVLGFIIAGGTIVLIMLIVGAKP